MRPSDNSELLTAALAWASRNYPAALVEVVLRFADKRKLKLPFPAEEMDGGLGARHSPDFRSVNWFGTSYSFTANQAMIVKQLWEAWESGTPEVGDQTLLVEADIQTERLNVIFQGHPAWRTMIQPGTSKGTHQLAKP